MTNYIKTIIAVFFLGLTANVSAQNIAVLKVKLTQHTGGFDIPVSVVLDALTTLPDSRLILVEVKGSKRVPVPYQVEVKNNRILHWLVTSGVKGQVRKYELRKGKPTAFKSNTKIINNDSALVITEKNTRLLRFNTYAHKLTFPQIKDTLVRSGFIHPLNTPHGQALTRIEAWDHKHHMGLWNAWTHILFEGDTLDLWNLYKKQGNIRFDSTLSTITGGVYSQFETLQQHVAYPKKGGEKTAVNELQTVRIYKPGKDYYLLDITVKLKAATQNPVILLKYSYGNMGWRATEKWNRNNSEVLTSEGKSRKEADGSRARWVLVQGALDNDYGGAVMMSSPDNYNHPEPLRVWPENIFNNGDMYVNFVPVKDRDWVITPGEEHVLKYRFLVFNGKYDMLKAEAAWQAFGNNPGVEVALSK